MVAKGSLKLACSVSNKTDHLTLNMTKFLPSFPMLDQPKISKFHRLTLYLACRVYNMYVESSRCIKPLAIEEKTIKHPKIMVSFIL